MPTSEQQRKERIESLFKEFSDKDVQTIDPILTRAQHKYPTLRRSTVHSYAEAVLIMLKGRKLHQNHHKS